jgi:hypothetical protein
MDYSFEYHNLQVHVENTSLLNQTIYCPCIALDING